MNYLFIILPAIAIATVVVLYVLTRNAQEIKEDDIDTIKFEPRKMTDLSKAVLGDVPPTPKKKKNYYKSRPKRSE